jgi:hypothetical protein
MGHTKHPHEQRISSWQLKTITGTILFTMRKESKDFDGASCDTKIGSGDGSRWWYINSAAMKWATSQ